MEKKNNNVVILVVAVLLSFVSGTIGSYLVITNIPSVSKQIIENVSKLDYTENSIADSVEKAYDAVVVVVSYNKGQKISTGTGFVYKKNNNKAYIMTNNHVIDGSDEVKIIRSDNEVIDASVVGGETYSDIAVINIPEKDALSVIDIGDSSDIRLGDTVFTIGSPLGETYSGTVTKGILSGKDRMVEVSFSGTTSDYYMKVLQTDAAINPGNSGGPLLNLNGEVIGINSLKLVEDEIEGMGFAIPIEDAIFYANTLEEGKTIDRPYVGISMLDVADSYYLWQAGINVPEGLNSGVAIIEVESGSPADKSGLQKGDIIIKLGEEGIDSLAEFRYELYKHSPSDQIEITYNRGGKEQKVKITLGKNS